MKRLLACLALGSMAVFGAASFAGAAGTPKSKSTTIRYFGKGVINGAFTNATGTPLSQSASPAVGDQFLATDNDYKGSSTHYSKTLAASDALQCTLTSVTETAVIGHCVGVISIGGSLLISVSTQNLASTSSTSVYPIIAGTGIFSGAAGRVVAIDVGKTDNSDFVIQVTTP